MTSIFIIPFLNGVALKQIPTCTIWRSAGARYIQLLLSIDAPCASFRSYIFIIRKFLLPFASVSIVFYFYLPLFYRMIGESTVEGGESGARSCVSSLNFFITASYLRRCVDEALTCRGLPSYQEKTRTWMLLTSAG